MATSLDILRVSLCDRKYATRILISSRRGHSRGLNRWAPLSIQCNLDMDRCIVQLRLTCSVALPIDNVKTNIENISLKKDRDTTVTNDIFQDIHP